MTYLAIARKWRPRTFEDLVGQGHVVQTLKNAILLERVSHAYLFSGARGVGKTSVARILAKALRCPNVKDASPCNACAECEAISESRSVDVIEIDGASNNGVEAVRGIRENVIYGASSGKYKIYIIDEVHMLSMSAFNALLKTLEEPPPHVIFLFATTEVQKIPLTILSRCQRFEFRRLSQREIADRMKVILKTENVVLSEEGLDLISHQSDGSLRDALSLLDQALSFYGGGDKPLSAGDVASALGVVESSVVEDFVKAIVEKDISRALALTESTYNAGMDLKLFMERSLEELRLLYFARLGEEAREAVSSDAMNVSESHRQALQQSAQKVSLLQLERMAQIFSRAIQQLAWSSLPRFVLEMVVVRLCRLEDLSKVEAALLSGSAPRLDVTPPKSGPSLETPAVRSEEVAQVRVLQAAPPPPPRPVPPPIVNEEVGPEQRWKGFVDFVMKKRPLLGALLSHANFTLEESEGVKRVSLSFSGGFYEGQASDSKNRLDTEELLRTFFGPKTVLILGKGLENSNRSLEQSRVQEETELKKNALEHPAVEAVRSALGADVVDVRIVE